MADHHSQNKQVLCTHLCRSNIKLMVLTQMALISDSWPVNVCLHMPSLTSQSLAEASQAPETNNLVSGASERLITSPVCPANVVVCWPVSMSQRALQTKKHKSGSVPNPPVISRAYVLLGISGDWKGVSNVVKTPVCLAGWDCHHIAKPTTGTGRVWDLSQLHSWT